LLKALPENPLEAAASLIYTACSDQTARDVCIKTLRTYAGNVLKGDPKFLRIKLGNAAFQARVASVLGATNFLEALGFGPSEEEGEAYLRLPAELVPTFADVSAQAFEVRLLGLHAHLHLCACARLRVCVLCCAVRTARKDVIL
jgi:hypothetical protein